MLMIPLHRCFPGLIESGESYLSPLAITVVYTDLHSGHTEIGCVDDDLVILSADVTPMVAALVTVCFDLTYKDKEEAEETFDYVAEEYRKATAKPELRPVT